MSRGIAILAVLAAGTPAAPMSAASRTGGAAPLSVFFDALDAARPEWRSGVAQPEDGEGADWDWAWDFGDPGSGTWAVSGRSKNAARGPVAAHVYERPGRYVVALTVTESGGKRRSYEQEIRVLPFDGPAYHVSSSAGDDRFDGLSPARPWRTLERARRGLDTGRRLLLKRGETFELAGGPLELGGEGPGHFGAYGPGEPPVLRVTGPGGALAVYGDDWRISDLSLLGPGDVDEMGGLYFDVQRPVKHTLIRRVTARNFKTGLGWGDHTPIYATPHDANTLAECEVHDCSINGVYVGGRRLALLGNTLREIRTSHAARIWQAHKAVLSHNAFLDPGPDRHALKLHGPAHGDGRPPSRHVVISDNRFRGKVWTVSIGPQNGESDERVSHVLFERNRTSSSGTVQVDLHLAARAVTVRNNVFVATGSSRSYAAVEVARRGIEPGPSDVRILHNTVLKADAGAEFSVCLATTPGPGLEVTNNLAWAPKTEQRSVVTGRPGVREEGNLLSDALPIVEDGRGALKPLPPASRGARPLDRVRWDFNGLPRPRSGACALGAFEP